MIVSHPFPIHREMGCTRAEFLSWLPGATREAAYEVDGDIVTVAVGGGSVQIALREKPPRRMGSVALPVLRVDFRFSGLPDAARERFLAYFDLYTRRGGG